MRHALLFAGLALICLPAVTSAQPPPQGLGDPLLHSVHVLNKSGHRVSVWIQVEDFDRMLHSVPGHAHGREVVAHPNRTSAGIWVKRVYIGVWDGIRDSKTIAVAFNGGPNIRRYVIRDDGVNLTLTEE